jgi:hypothetical protein
MPTVYRWTTSITSVLTGWHAPSWAPAFPARSMLGRAAEAKKPQIVDGYFIDYSQPSEKAINSVDPEMKAHIAKGRVISVKGEL